MFLPPEYAWLELVIIGAVAVLLADLIGNLINFENRFMNAFATAIVFAVVFSLYLSALWDRANDEVGICNDAYAPLVRHERYRATPVKLP